MRDSDELEIAVWQDGVPASSAEVFVIRGRHRVSAVDDHELLGRAAGGRLRVKRVDLDGWSHVVACGIGARGFAAIPGRGSRLDVFLESGHRITVKVTDPHGAPVVASRIIMSAGPLPEYPELTDLRADWQPFPGLAKNAVFGGTTGDEGHWVAESLSPGEYYLDVLGPGYIPVTGCPAKVTVPSAQHAVVLAPIYAQAVQMSGGEVAQWRVRAPMYFGLTVGVSNERLECARTWLTESFPAAQIVVVGVPDSRGGEPPKAVVELLDSRDTWQRHEVTIQPLLSIREVWTIPVEEGRLESAAELCVVVKDESGQVIEGVDLIMQRSDNRSDLLGDAFVLHSGTVKRIPRGVYRVRVRDPLLRPRIEVGDLMVTGDQRIDRALVATGEWRLVRIDIRESDGLGLLSALVSCKGGAGTRMSSSRRLSQQGLWWPVGEVIQLSVPHYSGTFQVTVEPGTGIQHVRLNLGGS